MNQSVKFTCGHQHELVKHCLLCNFQVAQPSLLLQPRCETKEHLAENACTEISHVVHFHTVLCPMVCLWINILFWPFYLETICTHKTPIWSYLFLQSTNASYTSLKSVCFFSVFKFQSMIHLRTWLLPQIYIMKHLWRKKDAETDDGQFQ